MMRLMTCPESHGYQAHLPALLHFWEHDEAGLMNTVLLGLCCEAEAAQ